MAKPFVGKKWCQLLFFFLKDDFGDVGGQFYQTCPSSSRAKGESAPRRPD